MEKLTPTQRKLFEFLKDSFYRSGSMPSLREMCQYMGWSAIGSAQDAVQILVDKGKIQRAPGKARGLVLKEAGDFRRIPILGAAPAGKPLEAIEQHDSDAIVPDFIRGPVFAVRVQGDSMEGAGIEDGDLAIVKQTDRAESNEIVLVLVDGESTIKRLKKVRGKFWLYPENEKYSPLKVVDPGFRILGRVVGVHRYWEGVY